MHPRLLSALIALTLLLPGSLLATAGSQEIRCGAPIAPSATPSAVQPGEWTSLSPMPRPRSELAAAVVGDWIYVVGGFGGLAQVECFHPASGTWATAPDLPEGVHHPGVASLEGVIYVAGGYTEDGATTEALWAFSPETGTWDSRAPMPTARGALGLVAADGKLYAIGGAEERLNGPVTGAVEIYNPATDSWSTGTGMPTPREHLAVVSGDGMVYAVGGRANGDEAERYASAFEAYDPATDAWEALPSLPTPRGGFTGVFVSGHVVVMGGERGSTTFDAVDAYDVATGEWTSLPPMPTARHGVATAIIGDTVYAIGGSTLAGRVRNTGAVEAISLPEEAFP